MQTIQYRADIDALRGLSVILVVFYHAFPGLVPGGFVGVDVFFVISGYLITSIILMSLDKGDFSLKIFYAKRIRRLFPALLVVLVFVMVLGWFVLFPDEYKQAAYHTKYSAIYWLNFKLIGELGYFDVESHYKPLLHLWSLSVEEQYYVIWPLLILLIAKFDRKHLLVFIMAIALASFISNVYFINAYPDEVYFHTLTRIWQLAMGSALAIRLLDVKQQKTHDYLMYLGLLLILSGAWIIDGSSLYPGWLALIPTVGAVLFIYSQVGWTKWGGLVRVGVISYPIYLWHWVLLSFLTIYIGDKPGDLAVVIAVSLSVVLAYLTWVSVERIRYLPGRKIPVLLLLGVVGVGLAGNYVQVQNGLPEREHLNYLKEASVQFARTPAMDEGCKKHVNRLLGDDPKFTYCRSGGYSSDQLIAVIGDSHAHAIFPGIAEEGRKHGYETLLFANSSCPTLIGFHWGRNPREIAECQAMIEQILSLVAKDDRIKKVFVSTRGPVYIHGEVAGSITEDSVRKSLLQQKDNPKQNYEAYFDGFRKLLRFLSNIESVDSIYYFFENPELDFLPKDVLVRPFDKWQLSVRESVVERSLYELRMQQYKEGMASVGLEFKQLVTIDPIEFMCDLETCFSFKDGKFLYADDDHFSVFGALYAAEHFSGVVFDD